MMLKTIKQGNYWKNEHVLFKNSVKEQPKSSFGRDCFAVTLCLDGNCDECNKQFAVNNEGRLKPGSGKKAVTDINYYLGLCYYKNENYEKSLDYFNKSVSVRSYGFFPLIQANLNQKELAFENMNKILSSNPDNFNFNYKAALLNCHYGLEKKALGYTKKLGDKPVYKTKKFNSCADIQRFSDEILYPFQ